MDIPPGNTDTPSTVRALRTYEDCLSVIEKALPSMTGEAAQILAQLRDFMKERLERASERAPKSTSPEEEATAAVNARIRSQRLEGRRALPNATVPQGEFGKGALED